MWDDIQGVQIYMRHCFIIIIFLILMLNSAHSANFTTNKTCRLGLYFPINNISFVDSQVPKNISQRAL